MPKISNKTNQPIFCLEIGDETEITMYGEIVESQPYDWWSGEPIKGSFIIQDVFLEYLDNAIKSGTKKLKLRMNSVGGDAGVSILIHNRLREASNSGIETTCIVDGCAMSGGSLIMSACDHVKVNPSSLIMIHKCWSFLCGGYNADELREKAKSADTYDKAQIEIYKRKCKLSDTVISHMMSETTYMTGKEAIEKGFADELTEDAEPTAIAASADRTVLFCNGIKIHLAPGMSLPENIPTVTAAQAEVIENKNQPDNGSNEGGTHMAKNLEELKKENPELASQIESDFRAAERAGNDDAIKKAAEEERKRISDIDAIAGLYDADTVREAKYGENPCTAQEMAFNAAIKAAKTGQTFMTNVLKDNADSNAGKVPAAKDNSTDDESAKTPEEKKEAAEKAVKTLFHKEDKEG